MAVTLDDVRHIASLARLGISDERATALVGELNTILAHMDVLAKVDTSGVDEFAGIATSGTPVRADSGPPIPMVRPIETIAPAMRDGFFLVPRLSTHEDADES
jgi:aspartyl-tRNA(Asn)/glutamyl-tRNA(Gln) amidotransferase subunit C